MEIERWQTCHSNAGNTLEWLALLLCLGQKIREDEVLEFSDTFGIQEKYQGYSINQ